MKLYLSTTDILITGFAIATVVIVLTKNYPDEGFDLYGGPDADTLIGDPGDNLIWGGAGADIIDGGEGKDIVDYGGSGSGVIVSLADNSAIGGDATGDRISNIESIYGSAHDDLLTGDNRANVLFGNAGADILDGKGSADRLEGGTGNDTFIFLPGDNSTDSVTDFTDGEDRIDLSGFSGVSFDDLAVSAEDTDCVIDLTGHGGGRIVLRRFSASNLDASDFLFAR